MFLSLKIDGNVILYGPMRRRVAHIGGDITSPKRPMEKPRGAGKRKQAPHFRASPYKGVAYAQRDVSGCMALECLEKISLASIFNLSQSCVSQNTLNSDCNRIMLCIHH